MMTNGATPEVLDKIFARGAASAVPQARPDGGTELIIPNDYKTVTLPPLDKPLTRIHQKATFYDAASFIAYINRYKTEATRVFAMPGHLADGKSSSITAILDYHQPDKADYGAHVVRYLPRYSTQWETWTRAQPMLQADFAEFIEENRADIRKPEAALLLDLISTFKATKKVDYDSVMHQPNGDILIGWSEKTETQGSRAGVAVPTELGLGLPVFFAGQLYALTMLMRYKLANGKVTFTVKPDGPAAVEQDAFNQITAAITEATQIEAYLGVPA